MLGDMHDDSHTLFRPPAEAHSLVLRVANSCPWNGCAFCGMYKGVPYQFLGLEHAEQLFDEASQSYPTARRIFLADGDVMHLDFHLLEELLASLNKAFPRLARISIYASGRSILNKTEEQLKRLKFLRLHTLYMGLESGCNQTLQSVNKQESAEEMILAGQQAQQAGLRMSVMVLTGLAGSKRSIEHARATADALNQMQPRLFSALRLVTTPNTKLYQSGFKMISQYNAVLELRELIQHLELDSTVFRADHSSNIIPLEARFPKDKGALLDQLNSLLTSGQLDKHSCGPLPFSL